MFAQAVAVIESTRESAPEKPGCYRMLDDKRQALYIGKARDLKKRLQAYTRPQSLSNRLQRMLASTHSVELLITKTESEALIMEASMIKSLKPRYNILLRDDKSFPSLLLRGDHRFPQILKHRGKQTIKGTYFGPFASSVAVNNSVVELQKIFLLRNCSDSIFAHRSRPCLQYHIKRCCAPCVGYVTDSAYGQLVSSAKAFLQGKSAGVRQRLVAQMERASAAREYERAAALRDRLAALTKIQSRSDVALPRGGGGDGDVISICLQDGESCVEMFCFRQARNCGNRAFFPKHEGTFSAAEIMASFIAQFYASHPPPSTIYAQPRPHESAWLEASLSDLYKRRVRILTPRKLALFSLVYDNAEESLRRRLVDRKRFDESFTALANLLKLPAPLERIEVYDNSHISSTHPYAVMIAADKRGFDKSSYRKFAIRNKDSFGDDYAMMQEALSRRFARSDEWALPSLLILDGGLGQISCAQKVLADHKALPILAIAKGAGRKASEEKIYFANSQWKKGVSPHLVSFPARAGLFYFLLRLRDEAHRFAIGTHRASRSRGQQASQLDSIANIGAVRKRLLLQHFGSPRAIADASIADLRAVYGLGEKAVQSLYRHFHG